MATIQAQRKIVKFQGNDKADIVRPLVRQHDQNSLGRPQPDETVTFVDDAGQEVKIDIWYPVYFLERHLDRLEDNAKEKHHKEKLGEVP